MDLLDLDRFEGENGLADTDRVDLIFCFVGIEGSDFGDFDGDSNGVLSTKSEGGFDGDFASMDLLAVFDCNFSIDSYSDLDGISKGRFEGDFGEFDGESIVFWDFEGVGDGVMVDIAVSGN